MTKNIMDLLSADNEVFRAYLFWSAVLVLKMLLMALLTGIQRFGTLTFANPEDCILKTAKVKYDNPNVERVRRAHLNDVENILPFLSIGLLYVLTNPVSSLAVNLFRIIGIARIIHTLVYAVYVVPQPARFIAFIIPSLATAYMGFQVVMYAL